MPPARRRRNSGSMLTKSAEFLGWALGGLEREIAQTRDRLAALNAEAARLRARLGRGRAAASASASPSASEEAPAARRKPRISAEGRRRIAEAQRRRWAKVRKKKGASS